MAPLHSLVTIYAATPCNQLVGHCRTDWHQHALINNDRYWEHQSYRGSSQRIPVTSPDHRQTSGSPPNRAGEKNP